MVPHFYLLHLLVDNMKYANTYTKNGVEIVLTVLPLSLVPGFDPNNPPQENTYCVPDEVEVGWIKQNDSFIAPLQNDNTVLSVTALQGLLALDHEGLSSYYEAWALAPERTFAQRAFINKAMTWRRDDPTLNTAATDLGLTTEQVDALFALATTL